MASISISAPMEMGLKIVTPKRQIYAAMTKAIAFELSGRMKALEKEIVALVANKLEESIRANSTADALINGNLKTELGVVDPSLALDQIITAVKVGVKITRSGFTAGTTSIKGGFRLVAIRSSFSDLLDLDIAEYISEKGHDIPWLRWLLLEGRKPVVSDYKIQFDRPKKSRTNDAIMRMHGSSSWGVPAEHAGDSEKNFITESIEGLRGPIETLVRQRLQP
tara:strand:+ start:6406 stop:7071 length:666 start_codon:yes stop_codon:yes gene_type:complete